MWEETDMRPKTQTKTKLKKLWWLKNIPQYAKIQF